MKLMTMLLAILLLSASTMLGAKKATKKAAPKKKLDPEIAKVAQPEKEVRSSKKSAKKDKN